MTDIEVSILYEDDDLLVVDKPPGLVVNDTDTDRGRSLLDVLRERRPQAIHRLDRDTSGVLALALNAAAAKELSRGFAERTVTKVYDAVVSGRPRAGREEARIGRDPRRPRARRARADGKSAETTFEILACGPALAWVEARPRTGRTHQIRVHLSHRGTPIFGDLLYGGVDRIRSEGRVLVAPRVALHARRLELVLRGRSHAFEAPVPDDMLFLIDACRAGTPGG